jgi:SAM-dependent methyltransferase
MDSSMQQKVALTTAHFPVRGRIADMGSGSGRGTFDLASLYDGLELVGVDINPISVERASEKFQRPNLSYAVGDISRMVFPANSLDGILDCSVLHHVTSFNNFDVNRVFETFDNQVSQLRTGGVIIIRDFVIPDGPEHVYIDLPENDGTNSGGTKELSSAALFELFAQTWRSSVNPNGPVTFSRLKAPRAGFARFEVTLRVAAEFVLRKDYRADWETEVLEEYTYLSQAEFEKAFRSRGLRIVTSRPLWNPWIVQNRFRGKFYLFDLNNDPIPYPPTNYLIVGEKVPAEDGVELFESHNAVMSLPKFLRVKTYKNRETDRVYELVERPNTTIDVLPWYEDEGQLFVLAKKDFPRPIVNAGGERTRLGSTSLSGYITEPISAIVNEPEFDKAVANILSERAGLSQEDWVSIGEPFSYFTSPGAINELVRACLVQVRTLSSFEAQFPNYTAFRSAGTVRGLDALQVLRASQVGGMFDARLEINVYHLLEKLGSSAGPWIGAPISLSGQMERIQGPLSQKPFTSTGSAIFEEIDAAKDVEFVLVTEGTFVERTHNGDPISKVAFEYVTPKKLSATTAVALPVMKIGDEVFVGLELRNLPAVQVFTGSSEIWTAPAWRVPREIRNATELPAFISDALHRDFRAKVLNTWELGGHYFCSPGVTPEVVHPFVAEIDAQAVSSSELRFVSIEDLRRGLSSIRDAHLLIASYRLLHAIGGR